MDFTGIDFTNDDQAGNKLNELICQVQSKLAQSEGTLLQITIGDKGTYLYVIFGAPTAHEDDIYRAVKAAIELRELIQHLEWYATLQIGVSTGMMHTGAYGGHNRRTYAVMGEDVNLAARLMSSAEIGEILVSNRVFKALSADTRLHGTSFLFEPRASIRIKGLTEPLSVFAIQGIRQERSLQLQEPVYALPMVGRQEELALIGEKIDQVITGHGQVIGITADAGISKSRLIAEAIRMARRRGLIGYGGACQSDGTNTSYLVWRAIWQAIFEINPDAPSRRQIRSIETIVEEFIPQRLDAVPLLAPLLKIPIPDNEFTASLEPRFRFSILEELLLDCLNALAEEARSNTNTGGYGGLCLVLEDLHWIDRDSSVLLEKVAHAIGNQPVIILLAYRSDSSASHETSPFDEIPYFTRISLSELAEADVEQAIRAKLAQLYPEWRGYAPLPLIQRVIAQSEGNPFTAEELLNYLHDQHVDLYDERAITTLEIPNSLQSLILSRIDKLTTSQQLTLKLASIIGRVFRFDHLHGYYPEQRPKDFLYADLNILAKLDLTPLDEHEPELTYLFRHIITHEVIYETLPASTRVALHELFAQFLEQLTGDDVSPYLDVLAYHYERSENLSKKLTYLRQAAEAAAAHFSNDSAIRYYQRAITILQNTGQKERDPALYTDLSERMAEILHLVTRYDEARFAYLNALKYVPDNQPTRRAQLTFKIGNTWREQHDFSGALEAYSQALQILGDPPHANGLMSGGTQESEIAAWQCWIQVHLEMLSAYYWLILVDQSEDLCQKIMPVVDRYGTPVQRSSLLQALAALSIRRARYYHPIDAVNYYYAALVEYQKVGLSEKIPAVRFQYGLALLYTDELHLAEIELGYALQLAEQRGDLSLKSRCLTYMTMLYRKKGQVEKVEEFAEYSESIATAAHMPEYSGAAMANRAWIAWRRNDLQATRKHARDALSQWDAAGVQTLATPYYWTAVWPLISVELRENQLSRAVELARSLLEPSRARMPDELTKTLEEACAAWDAEQSEVARELLQKATAQAEKFMYL